MISYFYYLFQINYRVDIARDTSPMKQITSEKFWACVFLIVCAFFVGISCSPEKTVEGTVTTPTGTIGPVTGGSDSGLMPSPVDPSSLIIGPSGSGMSCTD